jgi:hypothetical protein
MQKARGQGPEGPKTSAPLPPLVGTRFQDLFHPPPGVLFTFPSRYSFAIGHRLVFRLGRWSCQLQPGFLVSRLTQERIPGPCMAPSTGLSPSAAWRSSQLPLPMHYARKISSSPRIRPPTPYAQRLPPFHAYGLGCSPFARRYLGNHSCFLFLEVLRCFSSLGSPPRGYVFTPR